jgi:GNAT superfamily N-acetyltransferase
MGLTYFKRFRMEIDLGGFPRPEHRLPAGYRFIPWRSDLLPAHAEAKYNSFRSEIDANVFPCLGDYDGCVRLMQEISHKDGFLPEATWLVVYDNGCSEFCGTIQGIRDRSGMGAIQNLGIVPEHRGRGLGSCLMYKSLEGFRRAHLCRAYLEVTAQNDGAIKLYRRLGFVKSRTVYKAVEVTPFALR